MGKSNAFSVTPNMVRNVIVGTELTDPQIEGCISTATLIAIDNLTGLRDVFIPENTLTEIVLYLSAHFLSLRDRTTRIVKEKMGDAEVEYEASKPSAGYAPLDSTEWGATALLLDPTGILLSLGKLQPRLLNIGE